MVGASSIVAWVRVRARVIVRVKVRDLVGLGYWNSLWSRKEVNYCCSQGHEIRNTEISSVSHEV